MPVVTGAGNQNLLSRLGRPKQELGDIPAQSTPQALKNMLESAWGAIQRGTNPMVSKSEASWLLQLAQHPNADDSVRSAVADKLDLMQLSSAAKAAGFDGYIDQLRGGTADTGTTPPPTQPVDVVDTGPGTVSDTTNIPTGPTGPGNVLDVIGGGGAPAVADKQTNPLKYRGELKYPSEYKITDSALAGAYRGAERSDFGTTDVQLPGGKTRQANDMVYDLGNGEVGMNFIPVNDSGNVKDAQGNQVPGHQVMDNYLREQMGLGADDPIFALIVYVHPEEHTGDLKALGTQMVKTEMGATHMGAYVGKGRTTNSPEGYHNNKWGNKGYPANVQQVSLQGVDQGTLNRNMLACDGVLNKGVQFPPDYKNDKFRTVDLNTTLMFYRDWIQDAPYLKNDESWRTYCAEHKTIVTNIGLNVPHNEASFKEIFGNDEGAKLWGQFKEKFAAANGRPFTAADETSFEPLWKKEGLSADQIRPFADKGEYDKFDAARSAGDLANYGGFIPLQPGQGMAWAPETTADLLNDFLQTYTPVAEVGGAVAAAALMGFKDTITDRMGIDDMTYLGHAVPVINKMMIADAMMRADDPGYMKQATGELYAAFGGDVAQLMAGNPDPQLLGLVSKCLEGVKAKLGDIITDDNRPDGPAERSAYADAWLQPAIKSDLDRARKQAVADPSKTQFYSPPAVSHRVSVGMHESSKFVSVKTICTAVDASELE